MRDNLRGNFVIITEVKMIKKLSALLLVVVMTLFFSSCSIIEDLLDLRRDRTYNIHFNANGGEGEMEDYLVEKGDSGYLPQCKFEKAGFECVAWGLNPEGTKFATKIDNMTFTLPLSVKNGDTVELYAIWTTPGFTFNFNTMGFFVNVSLSDYDGNSKEVIIPARYEGPAESGYGSAYVLYASTGLFKDHAEIESVKNIPFGNITDDMFNGCVSLKNIEMRGEKEITRIGERAFYNCAAIEKLIITSANIEIGADAFYGWNENQIIEFKNYSENTFGEQAFNGCNATVIWSGTQ